MDDMGSIGDVGGGDAVGAVADAADPAPRDDTADVVADAADKVTPTEVQTQAQQVAAPAGDDYQATQTPAPAAPAAEQPSVTTQIGQALKGYATGAVNFAVAPANAVNALTNLAISPFTDYRFRTDLGIAPTSPMEASAQRGMENALTVGSLALGVGALGTARTATAAMPGVARAATVAGAEVGGVTAMTDLNATVANAVARGETVLLRGVAPNEALTGARIADGGFSYASGTEVQPAFALNQSSLRALTADQAANVEANLKFYADTGATLQRAAEARQLAGLPPAQSAIALRDYAAAYGIDGQGYVMAFSVPRTQALQSLAATANVENNVSRFVVAMPPNATPLGMVPSSIFNFAR